jgi:hypothetical protein
VADPALDIFDDLPICALVPQSVQVLGCKAQLDDQIARQVFRLRLTSFLPPEVKQRRARCRP